MPKIRSLAEKVLDSFSVPILAGPNRGLRLSLPICGRQWHGKWEPERVSLIERVVQKGDIVWDIGAHHGVTTLMASRLVGGAGAVHAFEPSKRNFDYLSRHVALNRAGNVTTHRYAVAAQSGKRRFGGVGSSQTFALDQGNETVRSISIADLLNSGIPAPTVIKLDAEGCEGEILKSGARSLPSNCRLIVSVHCLENYRQVTQALEAGGFHFLESKEMVDLVQSGHTKWSRDPDLLALGPDVQDHFSGFRSLSIFN